MSTGAVLARLGIEGALSRAQARRLEWDAQEQRARRVVHREVAGHARDAWRHTGEVAGRALDYLDASTDRFAAQAAAEVQLHTGKVLGHVEDAARYVAEQSGDPVVRRAYDAAEEAVGLAEEIQAFILARIPAA